MTYVDYLSVVRRRWLYLVVGLVAGALSGYLTAPGRSDDHLRFEATHTLIVDSAAPTGPSTNLDQAALLASTGPVPDRVAARLEADGLPEPSKLDATADKTPLSLSITAVASDAEAAEVAADLTADEIVAQLVADDVRAHDAAVAKATEDVDAAEDQRAQLLDALAELPVGAPGRSTLAEEIAGLSAQILTLRGEASDLAEQGPPEPPLRSLEVAKASQVDEGWSLPSDRVDRSLLLALLGLGLGLVGAFVAEQVDSRIRSADDAEVAFDLPVVAEVPRLTPRGRRRRRLVTEQEPASPFVEAYRSLRTVVLFSASEHQRTVDGSNGTAPPGSRVILVTSPSSGDGKTTTAAHLAAVLAEVGKRVLVIDADLRRPRIHEHFGIPHEPGLSDLLDADDGQAAGAGVRIGTPVLGVNVLPSGTPVDNPARVLTKSRHVIAAARRIFDYIVVDTPPLLVANDAAELAAETDMVVLVGKVGSTRLGAARRSTELLRRIDAPVLGVVLLSSPDTLSGYGYDRNRYYSTSGQKRSRRTSDPQQPPRVPPSAERLRRGSS